MKFRFKIQPYQTNAVESVVDCFAGQANVSGIAYRIDPGIDKEAAIKGRKYISETGFKNADIQMTDDQLLANIHAVQRRQNLPLSDKLIVSAGCKINLDVEMETGTGKTYCYIKTAFEMNKRYGWTKFIVVVPSIAIREGVLKSLAITAEHFTESYGKKARFFAYNSKQLHHLENFSSDAGINIMVINIQAFNATGKDNRRIYDELDDFQSRKPIDVISSNRPILILDEPQKMEGKKTLEALAQFKPLVILRYSATHRTAHNKIHRLDALDAYNQKLVKKIAARGIAVKGLAGTSAYLYLESIETSKSAPIACLELEVRQGNGIKRVLKRLGKGRDLFVESGELDQYRGFVLSEIDANKDAVEFTNGNVLHAGEATGDITETALRRIQIREAIKVHLEKERFLFSQGIKVLSLFFIDKVVKYRDYSQPDEQGEYARMFEEKYTRLQADYLGEFAFDSGDLIRNSIQTLNEELRVTPLQYTIQSGVQDDQITDSKVERDFVTELDASSEVVVYAKLPRGFLIPTPVGDYNPDWAIAFKEGSVKHIYFVAETKGSMSSMELRAIEHTKIECARKFFEEINRKIESEHVKYDVVSSYGKLMEIVGA